MTQIQVDVLLATFNGEKFLSQLLTSIAEQKEVNINLIISDDGSSDGTIEIIRKFENRFSQLRIIDGPRMGPAQNFFHLLTFSEERYVAFADQDDIWQPNHLIDSINRIRVYDGEPAVTFCDSTEFEGNMCLIKDWPNFTILPEESKFLFQNFARGCTMVLNRQLAELILDGNSYQLAVMHDWWIILVGLLTGRVFYGQTSEIYYRVHEDNTVGIGRRSLFASIKSLWTSGYSPLIQLIALYEISQVHGKGKFSQEMRQVVESFSQGFFQRFIKVWTFKQRFRSTLSDEIKLRLLLCLPRKVLIRNLKSQI